MASNYYFSQLDEANFNPDYEKDPQDEELAPPYKKKRIRKRYGEKPYPMCQETTTRHVARHCYMKHFPWWLRPDTACWYCRVQDQIHS